MIDIFQEKGHAQLIEDIPEEIPILPLRNIVAFPYSILPLSIGIPRSEKLIEDAIKGNRIVGLITSKDPDIEEPQPGQIYDTGTVASISRVFQAPNNTLNVVVQGLERFRIKYRTNEDPYLMAKIGLAPEKVEESVELEAQIHSLKELARDIIKLSSKWPDDIASYLDQVQDPRYLVYMAAANSGLGVEEAQNLLEADNIKDKLQVLISHLGHQKEVLKLGQKIQSDAKETLDKAQKEYFLRQQLKVIQKELGESEENDTPSVTDEYEAKLKDAKLPEEAEKEARKELKRLASMSPHSGGVPFNQDIS